MFIVFFFVIVFFFIFRRYPTVVSKIEVVLKSYLFNVVICCYFSIIELLDLEFFFPLPQGSQLPSETTSGLTLRNTSTMPAPRKLVQPASNGMPPPPPRGTMGPPPPPPPKFNSSITVPDADDKRNVLNKPKSETVPGSNKNSFTF